MSTDRLYQAKEFNLSGLNGISDQTLEMHFKLYEGYVKETNKLTEKIAEFLTDGKVDQEEMPAYSELTRRSARSSSSRRTRRASPLITRTCWRSATARSRRS